RVQADVGRPLSRLDAGGQGNDPGLDRIVGPGVEAAHQGPRHLLDTALDRQLQAFCRARNKMTITPWAHVICSFRWQNDSRPRLRPDPHGRPRIACPEPWPAMPSPQLNLARIRLVTYHASVRVRV